jgi:hypothetical protein
MPTVLFALVWPELLKTTGYQSFPEMPTSILPDGRPTADHSADAVAITKSPWSSVERTSTSIFLLM